MSGSDTIAAIATARGQAALAIVRMSGPEALDVAARCFHGSDLREAATHTAHVGYWEGADGKRTDQVVATVFRGPNSATGEDVVEVSCHGGEYVTGQILTSMVRRGATLARPGEFTQRAFLNGKIDLAQAEAVADLIGAVSARAHRTSVAALEGHYSKLLSNARASLLQLCALAELEIDFTDEDVEFASRVQLQQEIQATRALVSSLLDSCKLGEFVREGVRTVIAGRPNAGKSTLLNSLCARDRAIVSAQPGTTRDTLEADVEISGLRYRLMDTAGLRETADEIEKLGVERAQKLLGRADMILYVFDLTQGLTQTERDMVAEWTTVPVVVIGNKRDLVEIGREGGDHIQLCAIDGPDAVAPLKAHIARLAIDWWSDPDTSRTVMNSRHQGHLHTAGKHLSAALESVQSDLPPDLFTLDLRAAAQELGMITGAITSEEVLGAIFSRFCIGK
ncbi:MAG: tRNA uridine-5-carboxymethylaminomethyl(34) synthesis GTPase MnmE [Bacteroidota bacterium]|nr:tRNA uridine-5-carboxymethylaminomethyl(34) synthesis GTPase MnmE [Bacteroidota bacterium]